MLHISLILTPSDREAFQAYRCQFISQPLPRDISPRIIVPRARVVIKIAVRWTGGQGGFGDGWWFGSGSTNVRRNGCRRRYRTLRHHESDVINSHDCLERQKNFKFDVNRYDCWEKKIWSMSTRILLQRRIGFNNYFYARKLRQKLLKVRPTYR